MHPAGARVLMLIVSSSSSGTALRSRRPWCGGGVRSYRAFSASMREQASRSLTVPHVRTIHPPAHTSLGSVGGRCPSLLLLLLFALRPLVVILLLWWWLLQVSVDMSIVYDLTHDEQPLAHASTTPTLPVAMTYHTPEEECGTDHTHTHSNRQTGIPVLAAGHPSSRPQSPHSHTHGLLSVGTCVALAACWLGGWPGMGPACWLWDYLRRSGGEKRMRRTG